MQVILKILSKHEAFLNPWVSSLSFILALLLSVGCATKELPQEYKYPSWYYNREKSDVYYYGVGEAESIKEAKNLAIKSIVDKVMAEMDTNKSVAMRFSSIRIIEMLEYKKNSIALVSVNKKEFFKVNEKNLTIYLRRIKKVDEDSSDEFITRYIDLKRRVDDLRNFEEQVSFLQVLKSDFKADAMREEYAHYKQKVLLLKQAIRINIRADFNAIFTIKQLQEMIKKEKITLLDNHATFISDYRLKVSGECLEDDFHLNLKLYNSEDNIISARSYTFTCKDKDEKILAFEKLVATKDIFTLLGI